MTEPSPSVGDIVAAQIRRFRTKKGWSVRQLAEACAKQGAEQLTQASLANIERGLVPDAQRRRREVTVDELVALAVVLGVPPLSLLLPVDDDGRIEVASVQVTPATQASWFNLSGWLRAKWNLSSDLRANGLGEGWQVKNIFPVIDEYERVCEDEADLHRRLIEEQVRPRSAEVLRAAEQMYEGTLGRYVSALTQILEHGLTPPRPLHADRIVAGIRSRRYAVHKDANALFDSWVTEPSPIPDIGPAGDVARLFSQDTKATDEKGPADGER